jgi:cell division protein FtsL
MTGLWTRLCIKANPRARRPAMTDSDERGQDDASAFEGDLEIYLVFRGRGYDLKQFTRMIQGIEALIVLVLADSEGLDFEEKGNAESTLYEASTEKWYLKQRRIAAARIDVSRVILSSPLEFILYVAAISSALAVILQQRISVRNQYNESRNLAAKTDRDVREFETEQLAQKFIAGVISGNISPSAAKKILKEPIIKKAIDRSTKSLKHLKSVKYRRLAEDSDEKE